MSNSQPAKAGFRGLVLILGIVVLCLGFASLFSTGWSGPRVAEEIERSFTLADGQRLEVRGRNGTIEYAPWDGSEVVIQATKRVNGLFGWFSERIAGSVEIEIVQDGQGVKASERGLWPRFLANWSVSYVVLTPRGWSGDITLHTSNGRITAKGVHGKADLRSSNGAIRVEGQSGSLRARTSNGLVELTDVDGVINAESSNGPIRIEGGVLTGSGSVRTSNGAISIRGHLQPGAAYDARTSNGAVTLALVDPDVSLDLRTSNGSIGLDMDVTVSDLGRSSLQGRIGEGAATLIARTSNGSIRLLDGR